MSTELGDQPSSSGPWVEVPEDIYDSPRAGAFEKFFYWLLENQLDALSLPNEAVPYLVLELCSGDTVPTALGGGVGVSVIRDPRVGSRGFHDELRMVVAIGTRAREDEMADYYARLATIPHELGHIADFWKAFGTTPEQVARDGSIARWPSLAADCHGPIEELAKELTFAYTVAERPAWE